MQSSMLKSIVEDFGNGGVIDGDLVVEGDLTVSGGGSLSFDEIIEGTQVIDITSTEAFLVRKNGDGGDLFTLDTTNSRMLFAGEMRLNDKDGDGTFGGRIRYDNSDNELRIEANEVSGDDVAIKGNDAIKFEDSGGTKMILDGGNLGIGIENPDTLLHLKSTSASKPILKIENEQGGSNPVSIQMLRNTSSPDDDDFIGQIDFRSMNDASTPEEILYAYISSQSTDITDGTEDGELNFFTMKAGTLTNTMTMQSGLVGINQQDPVAELHIKQGDAGDVDTHANVALVLEGSGGTFLQFQTPSSATDVGLLFGDPGERDAGAIKYDHTNDSFKFHTDDVEKMRLTSTGQLGIGVTAPDKLLTLGQDAIDGGQTAYLKILDTDTDTTADTLLEILWSKYHTGTSAADVASIGGGVEQWSGTSSNRNTYMDFRTVTSGSRTEKMRITSGGSLAIGSSSASRKLHITDTSANAGIRITTGTALDAIIDFGDTSDGDIGQIRYDNNTDQMHFKTSTTDKFILDTNSRISLSNNDSGSNNTVFGKDAGKSLVSGANNNTFIGHNVADATLTDGADDNTGIGYNALTAHTSGNSNVAIGSGAMEANTTGNSNVAIGKNALQNIGAGASNNICIGAFAGQNFASADCDDNVVIGKGTGMGNLDQCVVIGKGAMTTTGTNAPSNSLGTVAIGTNSCAVLTTATGTTAVGYETCKTINVGDQNTAFGYQALKSADTGEYNVAVGYQALLDNVDGSHNTAVGRLALENFEPSSANDGHNSALGALAGNDISTGLHNTCIGSNSGHDGTNNLTTGSQNTFLGGYTNGSASGASNQTVIGYNANGQADNSVVLGNSDVTQVFMADDSGAQVNCGRVQAFHAGNGNDPVLHVKDTADTFVAKFEGNRAGDTGAFVRIFHNPSSPATTNRTFLQFSMLDAGSAETTYAQLSTFIGDNTNTQEDGNLRFSVMNNGTLTEHLRIDFDGDMTATNTTIASNSDERLKENIQDYSGGLDIITKLRPVTFEYKDSKRKQGTIRGFVAQEVKEVDDYWIGSYTIDEKIDGVENPEYEYVKDTDGQSLTSKISAKDTMYVSAIQELLSKIDALEVRIKELESK